MKIFVAVYQTGNITRAAERLCMTQPSVSRAIQELERYYGIKLFERLGKRLLVTECGKQFYAQALHIADAFDAMETGLRNWDELGTLRVGATITLGCVFLPGAISEFQERHPHLCVKATVCNGGQLERALLDNQLDIALIEGSVVSPQLTRVPFAQDRLVLIMSPRDPLLTKGQLYLSDLANCRFLMREKGSVGRNYLDHIFAAHGMPVVPLWESSSTHAIIQAVSMGLGISILPERLAAESVASGIVVTRAVADEAFRRTNYIVYHENKYLTKAAEEFIAGCTAGQAGKNAQPADASRLS